MRALVMVTLIIFPGPAAALADDSVVDSKHDLSVFGPGPVRAIDERRVCIFCHVPHNSSPAAPLWNRHNPVTHYRIYRSPTTDARVDQPGASSKLCLSCHDGSIAVGLTLDRPATAPIGMTHPYIPSGPADLTSDLSDDHPVGFRYDRALTNRDRQLRPPQLVDHRIKLGKRGEMECLACHDPHNDELGNFLRIPEREGALCTTCHDMNGWRLGAHANSPRRVPISITRGEQLLFGSLADNACRSCHLSHSAPWRDKLLYDYPSRLCLNCHDGSTGRNMLPVIDLRSGHRLTRPFGPSWNAGGRRRTARTVECTDCHNPHAVRAEPIPTLAGITEPGRAVPPAMRNVPGVSLAGLPEATAHFYYEVCFRCHSERAAPVRNRIIRQRDSDGNVRRQFLPTTASAHPVTFPSRRTGEVPSLLPEWRTRRFIGCQDCHNNPDSASAGGMLPDGPHGSRYDYLLVARYETGDLTTESPQAYSLCYRCHDRSSVLNDESFAVHGNHVLHGRTPCSACHSPHGVSGSSSQHGHLVNFDIGIVGGQRLYVDTGRFSGSCTLSCHGVQHVNFTYQP